jgi:phage portal protein BeeE
LPYAGATIYPPAYQQVLKGLPAVDYSAHDIIYRPRNVRAHRVYGYSPVQQVLMTVNIALRRQLLQLDYFSEGSIPDALIGVPTSWTPDQIKQFQDYWDTEFAGDLAKRRRAKFVPGEAAAKVVQTKEPSHKDDFDEWLARIICYAFSVPPQWAVKLMNRATADNQSAQAEDEGLEPTKEWVKDLIDEIIVEEFDSPDLELAWLDEDEADPEGAAGPDSGFR